MLTAEWKSWTGQLNIFSFGCNMSHHRPKRVGDLIKRKIGDLLLKEIKDPRIGFVTITRVRVTPDLKIARVYFSVLAAKGDPEESLAGLLSATEFIRSELKRRVRLRFIPSLEFILDDTLDYAEKIGTLLAKVKEEKE